MVIRRILFWPAILSGLFAFSLFPVLLAAQEFSPAQEKEYAQAKSALLAAEKAGAENYAPEPLMEAQDLLKMADAARMAKDAVQFTQASRLARAYAELSRVIAEVKSEEARLTAFKTELAKAKAELQRLKRSE